MSLPMAGITAIPLSRIPFIMSMNDGAGGSTAGFTQTMPAISGCLVASQTVRVPPIDRPTTTTLSQRPASSRWAASAAPDQSVHPVASMSSSEVP